MVIFRFIIIFLVVCLRLLQRLDVASLIGNGLLVVGWLAGYLLADGEKYLRRWIPSDGNSPVRNLVTAGIVLILGVWMVTSSGSPLAIGLVVGLNIKLLIDFLTDPNPSSWMWLLKTPPDNKGFLLTRGIWLFLTCLQVLWLVRL